MHSSKTACFRGLREGLHHVVVCAWLYISCPGFFSIMSCVFACVCRPAGRVPAVCCQPPPWCRHRCGSRHTPQPTAGELRARCSSGPTCSARSPTCWVERAPDKPWGVCSGLCFSWRRLLPQQAAELSCVRVVWVPALPALRHQNRLVLGWHTCAVCVLGSWAGFELKSTCFGSCLHILHTGFCTV